MNTYTKLHGNVYLIYYIQFIAKLIDFIFTGIKKILK